MIIQERNWKLCLKQILTSYSLEYVKLFFVLFCTEFNSLNDNYDTTW